MYRKHLTTLSVVILLWLTFTSSCSQPAKVDLPPLTETPQAATLLDNADTDIYRFVKVSELFESVTRTASNEVDVSLSAAANMVDFLPNGNRGTITATDADNLGMFWQRPQETPTDTLVGNPDDPATEAISNMNYVPRAEDYAKDHPKLGGIYLSYNTILLTFTLDTTVAQANAILKDMNAEIVGGFPGVADRAEGILVLRLPTQSNSELEARLALLRQEERIKSVVQDVLLEIPRGEKEDLAGPLPQALPLGDDAVPITWQWEVKPGGANWGLELIRAPQMWNFNAAIQELKNSSNSPNTTVGVLDSEFSPNNSTLDDHPDLVYSDYLIPVDNEPLQPGEGAHGTAVAGIIAAVFNNSLGVQGINPFADLVAVVIRDYSNDLSNIAMTQNSFAGSLINGYFSAMVAKPEIKVMNVSQWFNWSGASLYPDSDDPDDEAAADIRTFVSMTAEFVADANEALEARGIDLPLIVSIAGNDSRDRRYEARWASPFNYAALGGGNPDDPPPLAQNIIVVEAVEQASGNVRRAAFSNFEGTISAPGASIGTTSWPDPLYDSLSGTSFAAPFVSGLVAYLYDIEPGLTHSEVLDLLVSNSVPTADGDEASNYIDVFATVMAIDNLPGRAVDPEKENKVLRMLLDIDDGTPDGNQRVLIGNSQTNQSSPSIDDDGVDGAALTASEPLRLTRIDWVGGNQNEYGPIGDGKIDMSDFRRWRDWLLQVEAEEITDTVAVDSPFDDIIDLNGSKQNLKRDLNLDGEVILNTSETGQRERLYPRGDFNGDGVLSRSATYPFPRYNDPEKSDFAVFFDAVTNQGLWDDPYYQPNQLEGLLDSADIEVWPYTFFNQADVNISRVDVSVRKAGTPPEQSYFIDTRTHRRGGSGAEAERQVFTLSVPTFEDIQNNRPDFSKTVEYLVRAVGYDVSGKAIAVSEVGFSLKRGSDAFWDPQPCIVSADAMADDVEYCVLAVGNASGLNDLNWLRTFQNGPRIWRGGVLDAPDYLLDPLSEDQQFGQLTDIQTINDKGHIAGYDDGAVLIREATRTDLPSNSNLPGLPRGALPLVVSHLSNQDVVVGYTQDNRQLIRWWEEWQGSSKWQTCEGCSSSRDERIEFYPVTVVGIDEVAMAVNDQSTVLVNEIRDCDAPEGGSRIALWSRTGVNYVDLGANAVSPVGTDLNDEDTVIGNYLEECSLFAGKALFKKPSGGLVQVMQFSFGSTLCDSYYGDCSLSSINNKGDSVGWIVLGAPIGVSNTDEPAGNDYAFIWRQGSSIEEPLDNLVDPLSEWKIVSASSINNNGVISAIGLSDLTNQFEDVLLIPFPER